MWTFLVLLVLAVGVHQGALARRHGKDTKSSDGKIVGGYNTTIEQFPYQVYLLLQKGTDYYQCGGSLISTRYVLTAAHCLVGVSAVYVRTGSTNSDNGGKLYYTMIYRMHPMYNARTSDYDIAVVDLLRNIPIDGRTTKIIPLPAAGKEVQAGTEIIVSGWGTTSEEGQTSQNLMAVKVQAVSTQECKQAYGSSQITTRMFCAGAPQGGKDSCQGDSGGPAATGNGGTLVGVVSYGNGCARRGYPGVYTNVSALRSWIRDITGV